jgi:hypothetical protein
MTIDDFIECYGTQGFRLLAVEYLNRTKRDDEPRVISDMRDALLQMTEKLGEAFNNHFKQNWPDSPIP